QQLENTFEFKFSVWSNQICYNVLSFLAFESTCQLSFFLQSMWTNHEMHTKKRKLNSSPNIKNKKPKRSSQTSLLDLPNDVIPIILSYSDNWHNLSQTCKFFRNKWEQTQQHISTTMLYLLGKYIFFGITNKGLFALQPGGAGSVTLSRSHSASILSKICCCCCGILY